MAQDPRYLGALPDLHPLNATGGLQPPPYPRLRATGSDISQLSVHSLLDNPLEDNVAALQVSALIRRAQIWWQECSQRVETMATLFDAEKQELLQRHQQELERISQQFQGQVRSIEDEYAKQDVTMAAIVTELETHVTRLTQVRPPSKGLLQQLSAESTKELKCSKETVLRLEAQQHHQATSDLFEEEAARMDVKHKKDLEDLARRFRTELHHVQERSGALQQRLERERSEAVAEVDSDLAVPDFDQLERLQNARNTELIELRGTCQRQQADLACVREEFSALRKEHQIQLRAFGEIRDRQSELSTDALAQFKLQSQTAAAQRENVLLDQIRRLELELEQIRSQRAGDAVAHQAELDRLHSQAAEERKNLVVHVETLSGQLRETNVRQLRDQSRQYNREISALEKLCADKDQDHAAQMQRLNALHAQSVQQNEEVRAGIQVSYQKELEFLREQLRQMEDDGVKLALDFKNREAELSAALSQCQSQLKAERSALEHHQSQQEATIARHVERMRSRLEHEHRLQLAGALRDSGVKVSKLEEEFHLKVEGLSAEIAGLQHKLRAEKDEIDEVKRQSNATQLSQEAELKALREQVKSKEEDIVTLRTQLKSQDQLAKQAINTLRNQHQLEELLPVSTKVDLENTIHALKQQVKFLQRRLELVEGKHTNLSHVGSVTGSEHFS